MPKRRICITEFDKSRLEELIAVAKEFGGHARDDLDSLAKELQNAEVVESKKMRPDVVTMNSRVVLRDVQTSKQVAYTLVFPKNANPEEGAISILAPVGTAILGYAKGDVIEWPVPSGTRSLAIEEILYQPEAAGDFHL